MIASIPAIGDAGADAPAVGYYGLPVIHGPHWKWLIIGYFYCGGISGGAATIGAVARLAGGAEFERLSRISTYVSFAALLPCPVLLILDLGRPARFHNMLRAFRPSSPMSMGTWGLMAFSMVSSLSVVQQLFSDIRQSGRNPRCASRTPLARLLALSSGAAGMFVAGYTGVLLAATAVPVWSKRPLLIAPLFVASAMTSSAAAITGVAEACHMLDAKSTKRLRQFESFSTEIEGILLLAWIASLGPTAKPLNEGLLGYVVRRAVVGAGIAVPLLLSAAAPYLPRHARRAASLLGSALTLTGVFALRYAIVEAGRLSANDPVATFDMTG